MSVGAKIEIFSADREVEVEISRGGRCTTIRLSLAEARTLSRALADAAALAEAAGPVAGSA